MLALLARSVHGLAHSLRSLPRGTVEIHETVFTLKSRTMGTNVIFVITRNTPKVLCPEEDEMKGGGLMRRGSDI